MKSAPGAAPDVLTLLAATNQSVRLDTATVAAPAFVAGLQAVAIRIAPPLVDVPADGVEFPFDWGADTPGTDRVELAPVVIDMQADSASNFGGYLMGELAAQPTDGGLSVSIPGGRHVRALTLTDLTSENIVFRNKQQLEAAGRRLTVSVRDPRGGWAAPTMSVPAVARRGAIPPTLTGASLADGVLRLPDLTGPIRIAIVGGDTPEEFSPKALTVGTVIGWAAPTPVDLTLTGPDGATLWNFPGALPDGTRQAPDVTVAVSAAVEALRTAGKPITGSLALHSKFPCKVRFAVTSVQGDLIRELAGTTTVELAGEPVALPLVRPLPPGRPGAAIADVKVTYRGKRLADISDPLPPPGPHRGVVVRSDRVLRALPPQALRGEHVSRIGLVGYCPQPTALLVRVVPAAATAKSAADLAPIGTPGTAMVDAAAATGVIWVDLPEPIHVDQPVAIEVSAGTGTLFWVADPDPLIRVVVLDPDPGRRPIVLGAVTLLTVDEPAISVARASLPTAPFADTTPLLASALFCTVEISDGQLRYPRGA
ncbi:hypothetical protein CQY20_09175 [Mycolicibacterium agri]|uniref:Uncharacterized protein n=1 Tax=Mycolicibacterium agri TaxID=36811 RepID=A0A2A7N750_MYCAG|nr:hypothetical protein [Mycolicibacterium agri]PEG39714.1 hypothetical protein CQY20_09175 [Mycolicibacterium agri]GFG52579.1 hypothetical protein MAGR_40200 [Mycolicibacterium agri]